MENNTIKTMDSLEYVSALKEYSQDIMFCDPPYALGSEVIVRPDGKVDYKKAVDFMSKWDMPTGEYWEQWFKEVYRSLKHGGHLVMYGMDRQLLLFKYYGHLAGFTEKQSMYWYFISNFPKATDLSKMIDKNAGAERERNNIAKDRRNDGTNYELGLNGNLISNVAITDLAKKYDGYKYSISPLKQTNETIMVFQKPYKTGSCLHDTLAYENGDTDCTCGALDIDGNRVGFVSEEDRRESTQKNQHEDFGTKPMTNNNCYGDYSMVEPKNYNPTGRYPAQTFVDDQTAGALDVQSGVSKSSKTMVSDDRKNYGNSMFIDGFRNPENSYNDIGGCSKILHKCNYEEAEHDLYIYQPKVSKAERNAGCENNHPTLKPIDLNYKILKLFKTPNEQTICFPFAGAGSEIIGGIKAGFNKWHGCEISEEYVKIANARIKHWQNKK